jgi:iron(III) transport system permease protein
LPTALIWVLVALLAFAILYPLARLIILAFVPDSAFTWTEFSNVFGSAWFGDALRNTAISVVCASALGVTMAAFIAWVNERTDASLGWLGQILPLTPMVVPGVAVGTGWVLLASPDVGFLRRQIEKLPALDQLVPAIYSLPGLIFVEMLVLVPFVFLILQNAFRNLDPALEEASLTSGAGNLRTLLVISLPAVRNAIGAALLLGAVVAIGEYSVPVIIATPAKIDILSVRAVQFVTAQFPAAPGSAAVLGLLMLVATVTLWIYYYRISKAGNFAQIGSKPARAAVMKLGAWKWPIRLALILFLMCGAVLPVGALAVVAFQPYWSPTIDFATMGLDNFVRVFEDNELRESVINSARFAAIGAAIAVGIVWILTSAHKISKLQSANVGLAIMKAPATVANVVLGLGMLIAFYGTPFHLGGTAILLIGAYVVITLPYASILGEAATVQIRDELLEASEISGASNWRTQWRILTPLALPGFVAAYALVFAMLAGEVSVSRLLAKPGTLVVGFSVVQVYQTGSYGQLAVLAILVSGATFVVVAGLMLISRWWRNKW